MRTLEFNVEGQKLEEAGDFSGLAKDSKNYIQCKFDFDAEWMNTVKVAEFENTSVLIEDDACMVPETASREMKFRFRVIGKGGETYITTNTIEVRQEG